jgi:hypothetical protein
METIFRLGSLRQARYQPQEFLKCISLFDALIGDENSADEFGDPILGGIAPILVESDNPMADLRGSRLDVFIKSQASLFRSRFLKRSGNRFVRINAFRWRVSQDVIISQ